MKTGVRLRAGAVAVGMLILVAGCTSSTADGPTTTPLATITGTPSAIDPSSLLPSSSPAPPSPSPSVVETSEISPQEAADRAAVEAVWAAFWKVSDGLTAIAVADRPALASTVAVEPTLSQALDDARSLDSKGREVYGQSYFHPYWEQPIDGKSIAVMGDCTDTSMSGARDKATGEIRTVGVTDNNTRATFVRESGGVWKVKEIFYLLDQPCP